MFFNPFIRWLAEGPIGSETLALFFVKSSQDAPVKVVPSGTWLGRQMILSCVTCHIRLGKRREEHDIKQAGGRTQQFISGGDEQGKP